MEEAFKINQKTNRQRNDTAVQGTNDSSVLSKISAAECGYHEDEFLKYFASKIARRSPLVNRGYYIRAKLIDYVIKEFLYEVNNVNTKNQIINLGAGFDSSFFRLKHLNLLQNTIFIEIDFPDVINRKFSLITKTNNLQDMCPELTKIKDINGNTVYKCAKSNYFMIGMDMRNTKLLEAFLKAIEVFSDTCPTLLLSEVVLTYMAVNSCNGVIRWIAEALQNCVLTVYEQINPFDGFGQVMCSHFKKLGSPLRCILKYPSEADQSARYKQAGFSNCYTVKASDFYQRVVADAEKARVDKLELFDEYEAWHLKCTHYTLLSAVKGELCDRLASRVYARCRPKPPHELLVARMSDLTTVDGEASSSVVKLVPFAVRCGSRFGHSMVCVAGKLFVFGGFGELATDPLGKHLRLAAVEVVDLVGGELTVVELGAGPIADRIFHSCAAQGENTIYVSYGRTNPSKLYDSIVKISISAKSADQPFGQDQMHVESIEIANKSDVHVLPRFRHASCVVPDGRLFIHGGKHFNEATNSNSVLGDAFFLDSSNSLVKLELDLNVCKPRHSHALAVWNNFIVLTGGIDENENPLNDVILIDAATLEVKTLNMTKGHVLPRYSHTCHVVDDYLILVGGVNYDEIPPGVCIVNLTKLTAFEFNLPVQTDEKSPFLAVCHQTHLLDRNRVLLVGGGAVCFTFGTHLNRQPVVLDLTDCWARVE